MSATPEVAAAAGALSLEYTILPSPNSIDLERSVGSDYLYRCQARFPHVAELFHENSKFAPSSTIVPAADEAVAQARQWYFDTSYRVSESEFENEHASGLRMAARDLPPCMSSLLADFKTGGSAAVLLFSIDLFVFDGERVLRLAPGTHELWLERYAETDRLRAGLLNPNLVEEHSWAMFLVARPWRYMAFYGPRGYRATLLDAGRVLRHLETRAHELKIGIATAQQFYDARVDSFLGIDGVEASTVAVICLTDQEV